MTRTCPPLGVRACVLQQVFLYALGKCDTATRSLLFNDALMDMKGLEKREAAGTMFIHDLQG